MPVKLDGACETFTTEMLEGEYILFRTQGKPSECLLNKRLSIQALGKNAISARFVHDHPRFSLKLGLQGRTCTPQNGLVACISRLTQNATRITVADNLDLVTNNGWTFRKVVPWMDRFLTDCSKRDTQRSQEELDAIMKELASLDADKVSIDCRLKYSRRLQRGVSMTWMLQEMKTDESDAYDMSGPENALSLVGDNLKRAELFSTCASFPPSGMLDGFVSHSWKTCEKKRAECLKNVLVQCYGTSCDEGGSLLWRKAHLWIDKFSSPQGDSAIEQCRRFGFFFQEYLAICPRLFILCSPEYLSRLWCRFEVVAFLALHSIQDVYVALMPFLNEDPEVWKTYEEHLRTSCTANSGCAHESDKAILQELEQSNFKTEAAADELIRFSTVALLGRTLLLRGFPDELKNPESFFCKLLGLCTELQFHALAAALAAARDSAKLQECVDEFGDIPNVARQEFTERVVPLLDQKQVETMKPTSPLLALRSKLSDGRASTKGKEKDMSAMRTSLSVADDSVSRSEYLKRALARDRYKRGDLQRELTHYMDYDVESATCYVGKRAYSTGMCGFGCRLMFIAFGILFLYRGLASVNLELWVNAVLWFSAAAVAFSTSVLVYVKRVGLIKYVHMCLPANAILGCICGLASVPYAAPATREDGMYIVMLVVTFGLVLMYAAILCGEQHAMLGYLALCCSVGTIPFIREKHGTPEPFYVLYLFVPMGLFCFCYVHGVAWRKRREAWGRLKPVIDEYKLLYVDVKTSHPRLLESLNQKLKAMEAACADSPLQARQLTAGGRPMSNMDDLYEAAALLNPLFAEEISKLCSIAVAEPSPPVNLKSAKRSMQKVWRSYNGDVSRLRDVCRSSIVLRDMRRLLRCVEAIERSSTLKVVGVKNRFAPKGADKTHYRDVNLRLCVVSNKARELGVQGFVVELQLVLLSYWHKKTHAGHHEYVKFRDTYDA